MIERISPEPVSRYQRKFFYNSTISRITFWCNNYSRMDRINLPLWNNFGRIPKIGRQASHSKRPYLHNSDMVYYMSLCMFLYIVLSHTHTHVHTNVSNTRPKSCIKCHWGLLDKDNCLSLSLSLCVC